MPWVKLDDGFFRHTKVVRAKRDARDLYLAGLCYVAANLTDGLIPVEALPHLATDAQVRQPSILAARLVEVGLWEVAEGGYAIHDYLVYNPTRERVLATRSVRAQTGARGGKQKASNLLEVSQAFASESPKQNPTPYPNPVPVVPTTSERLPEKTDTKPVVALAAAPSARALVRAVPKDGQGVPKPHQAMIAALGESLGAPKTRGDWGKYATAAADLCKAGALPEAVPVLVDRWGEMFPEATCTPFALANNYATLTSDRKPKGKNGHRPEAYDALAAAYADLDPRRNSLEAG